MERVRFVAELRAHMHQEIFAPFTITLSDGGKVEVECRDALAVRDGIAFYIAQDGSSIWIDSDKVDRINS
jgi:hypothetical protein